MFLNHKDYEHHTDIEIKAVKNPTSEKSKKYIASFCKSRRLFMPKLLWKNVNNDDATKCFCLSLMLSLYIFLLFPVSVMCVERLFSKMKLIKTRVQN